MSGTTRSRDAGLAGVEDMAQDFWATRPRRPRRGRKIAGVAAGIGNRYGIDPTLVRVGLVVAALYGGAGVVVYLLGWLFLPEQDDEVSPFESLIGRGRSSTSSVFTLVLCLAFIPTFSWFFNGFVPGYLSLLVVAGALYLLHRNRGHIGREHGATPATETPVMPTMPVPPMPPTPPAPPTPPTPPTTMAASTGAPAGTTVPLPVEPETTGAPTGTRPTAEHTPEPEVRTTPPAWDPLGAAPFAWDLPDPNLPVDDQEPEPPQRRRKSRVGVLTVGIALIVVACMSMGMGGWINAQHMVGVALAILGLGMVAGSFVRGGRGLIGLAVPLSVVGIGLTAVSPQGWNGFGDLDARPTNLGQLQSQYSRSVGSISLDLTALDFTAPRRPAGAPPETDTAINTEIDLGVGDVTVMLPSDADVWLSCHTDLGSVDCLGSKTDGVDQIMPEIVDYGSDGRGGPEIHMTIDVGTGSLDVHRG